MIECVVNVSEGRRPEVVDALAAAAGADLLDVHTCGDHHRSVLTLVGEDAPRAVARAAVELLDLRDHRGPIPGSACSTSCPSSLSAPRRCGPPSPPGTSFAAWAAAELGLPCFVYGPERSLPEVRRGAFTLLAPDTGPSSPHPSAGAVAVGARRCSSPTTSGWPSPTSTRPGRLARVGPRRPAVRALGLAVGDDGAGVDEPDRPEQGGAGRRVGPGRRRGDDRPGRAGGPGARGGAGADRPRSGGRSSTSPRTAPSRRGCRSDQCSRGSDGSELGRRPGSGTGGGRLGGAVGRRCGGPGQRPLAADAATLTLAHAAPDAELLTVGQGVLEAVLAHDAAPADLLGLPGGRATLGEEEVRVDAKAVGEVLPGLSTVTGW